MRRLTLLILAIALMVGVAACGGGDGGGLSTEEYEAELGGTGDTLEETFGNLAARAQSAGVGDITSVEDLNELLGEIAGEVDTAVTALEEAASDLDSIEPPGDATEAHGKLVQGMRLLADDLVELSDVLRSGELSELPSVVTTFQEIAASEAGLLIQEAMDELEKLGYDLGGVAE